MSAKAKRGGKGAKGATRTAVLQTGCLHTNAGIQVWGSEPGPYTVAVTCPECKRSERLTDRDAGAILALVGGV